MDYFTGIKKEKQLGLEVFIIYIRGVDISTHLSEVGARIKIQRLINNNKKAV